MVNTRCKMSTNYYTDIYVLCIHVVHLQMFSNRHFKWSRSSLMHQVCLFCFCVTFYICLFNVHYITRQNISIELNNLNDVNRRTVLRRRTFAALISSTNITFLYVSREKCSPISYLWMWKLNVKYNSKTYMFK